ncbi:MAG: nitrite reductase, copper-containing [Candidatus Marinimicrobia bacterium]|nr:nitrite reductase, copper-containing [Candidatus Neomarinimicrobiota bacterium]MCF7829529.1 nitrite reductase, copper-containing [Candidatus Neomarinimicrobiota bacterium]MCF7880073.1 nitrite reductase, copper-containing [Candidatus Neomarinimicrobiota bacterium]
MDTKRIPLWIGIWVGGIILVISLTALFRPNNLGSQARGDVQFGEPDAVFYLETAMNNGRMVFAGAAGDIDDAINPTLSVAKNDVVKIILLNGDGGTHDVAVPAFDALSDRIMRMQDATQIVFKVNAEGNFYYYCTVAGHRVAGMEGVLRVGAGSQPVAENAVSISRDPSDLPPPIDSRPPKRVQFDFVAQEVTGKLSNGASYDYYTFNGQVPGPFLRVRENDQVEIHLTNPDTNTSAHSIDFHAVTGPGGGAAVMSVSPGNEKSFTFKALKPGLYVYHCATPMVAHHIANGMYGMILVEPESGLKPVDHEFYVMQQELYTKERVGKGGHLEFDSQKLMDETPEYFVLNGAVGSLTSKYPMDVKTGETARIFFGVGGPNKVSSFHIIGEIMDAVYANGSMGTAPMQDIQTTLVAPGSATIAELEFEVPGTYKIVDHALTRVERGLIGFINVTGPQNPEIFNAGQTKMVNR